jgi:hypothetical protein
MDRRVRLDGGADEFERAAVSWTTAVAVYQPISVAEQFPRCFFRRTASPVRLGRVGRSVEWQIDLYRRSVVARVVRVIYGLTHVNRPPCGTSVSPHVR